MSQHRHPTTAPSAVFGELRPELSPSDVAWLNSQMELAGSAHRYERTPWWERPLRGRPLSRRNEAALATIIGAVSIGEWREQALQHLPDQVTA